jgi:hypothetical protein
MRMMKGRKPQRPDGPCGDGPKGGSKGVEERPSSEIYVGERALLIIVTMKCILRFGKACVSAKQLGCVGGRSAAALIIGGYSLVFQTLNGIGDNKCFKGTRQV